MAVEICACAVSRPRFQTSFRKRRRQQSSLHVTGRQVVEVKHAGDDSDVRQRKECEEHGRRRMIER